MARCQLVSAAIRLSAKGSCFRAPAQSVARVKPATTRPVLGARFAFSGVPKKNSFLLQSRVRSLQTTQCLLNTLDQNSKFVDKDRARAGDLHSDVCLACLFQETCAVDYRDDCPRVVVVLLGWLGSQQKHLRLYEEWYRVRGMETVTVDMPLGAALTAVVQDGRAEELTGQMVNRIQEQVGDGSNVRLMFHTFSNTGWLLYGAILETLRKQQSPLEDILLGCVVDSAPGPGLSPEVWARGFAAAILGSRLPHGPKSAPEERPASLGSLSKMAIKEALWSALGGQRVLFWQRQYDLLMRLLRAVFSWFLAQSRVRQRLQQVLEVLEKSQPIIPQLYVYSTSDAIIPHTAVESFIDMQRAKGHPVAVSRMYSSPHVDHFRHHPAEYARHLSDFLRLCIQHKYGGKDERRAGAGASPARVPAEAQPV